MDEKILRWLVTSDLKKTHTLLKHLKLEMHNQKFLAPYIETDLKNS